jgi:hypothetical protein
MNDQEVKIWGNHIEAGEEEEEEVVENRHLTIRTSTESDADRRRILEKKLKEKKFQGKRKIVKGKDMKKMKLESKMDVMIILEDKEK